MEWLNYHHLFYFWTVVREGGVAAAARKLRLAHPTVSGQIRALEDSLGEPLLVRVGRRVEPTEVGKLVFGYADEIFALGQELLDSVKGREPGGPQRLAVGISEVVPKLVAKHLLAPALALSPPVRLVCREDKADRLVTALAAHELDVVLTDAPLPPSSPLPAFNHPLGECAVALLAVPALAAQVRQGFPRSLDGAPMLLPTEATALRRTVDQWLRGEGVAPRLVAEFDDSELMKVFGEDGHGVFPFPAALAGDVTSAGRLELVATVPELRESYWAITVERRLKNPAVLAISQNAREALFGGG